MRGTGCEWHNFGMPTLTVHKQLAALLAEVYGLSNRAKAEAPIEELRLRASSVIESLDAIQVTIGAGPTCPFYTTARHIHWLTYWCEKVSCKNPSQILMICTHAIFQESYRRFKPGLNCKWTRAY
jgi:hypothetical protein